MSRLRNLCRFSVWVVLTMAVAGCQNPTENKPVTPVSDKITGDKEGDKFEVSDKLEESSASNSDLDGDFKTSQTDSDSVDTESSNGDSEVSAETVEEKHTIDIPANWKRLSKTEEIWIDTENREVIVGGFVCLDTGPLEMFVCPLDTKEHESVVSVHALSSQVHACLIALNADPGSPTTWDPDYVPAHGPKISVEMIWKNQADGKINRENGKKWIKHMATGKTLQFDWVFGGSGFWKDPDSGEEIYYGNGGEMICLSNFSTATIDLNVESSESTSDLAYTAFTENIPPVGTKVYVVIKPGEVIPPKRSEKQTDSDEKESSPPEKTTTNQVPKIEESKNETSGNGDSKKEDD
ncbi:MAG: YdjY domain-containing protein [Planctomycetota bacterium]